jgi:5'(3')-deoxyribonucleotidase
MPTIYLDMDGVLADFNTAARTYLKATPQEEHEAEQNGRWPEHKWRSLVDAPNFYRHLPKMPKADELVKLAYRFKNELGWDLRILTAIPTNNEVPDVFQDKFDWMAEYYPGIRLCFGPYSTDKHRHARPGDILVDDRESNCREWTQAGQRAVRVLGQDYQSALDELAQILDTLKGTGN